MQLAHLIVAAGMIGALATAYQHKSRTACSAIYNCHFKSAVPAAISNPPDPKQPKDFLVYVTNFCHTVVWCPALYAELSSL